MAEAKAYVGQQRQIAELESFKIRATQETRLEIAKTKCPALIIEAEANQAQEENLQPLRKFDERMALTESFTGVAAKNKIIASGEQGKEILGYLIGAMDQAAAE